jgi:hypothetical protein
MTTLEVKLTLPEQLAKDLEATGLLKPKAIERLLREAARRRALKRFLAVADRVKAAKVPPMSLTAIQAEVRAVRKSKRAAGR